MPKTDQESEALLGRLLDRYKKPGLVDGALGLTTGTCSVWISRKSVPHKWRAKANAVLGSAAVSPPAADPLEDLREQPDLLAHAQTQIGLLRMIAQLRREVEALRAQIATFEAPARAEAAQERAATALEVEVRPPRRRGKPA